MPRSVFVRSAARVFVLSIVVAGLGGCGGCSGGRADARASTAAHRAQQGGDRWIPDEFGVERAVVVVADRDLADEQIFRRDDDPDVPSQPVSIVSVVTLVAGLRSGLVTANTRHTCAGYGCWRAHGEVSPADALALACNSFFENIAARTGTGALGAAFASLGLDPPPIPEDSAARVRLATRAEGWSISPRTALRLARALTARPGQWPEVFDEALVPRVSEPGALRGVVGGNDTVGWFVGFTSSSGDELVVARATNCRRSCAAQVLRIARWAVERVRGAGATSSLGRSPGSDARAPSTPPRRRRR